MVIVRILKSSPEIPIWNSFQSDIEIRGNPGDDNNHLMGLSGTEWGEGNVDADPSDYWLILGHGEDFPFSFSRCEANVMIGDRNANHKVQLNH